jgi:phosphoribosylanthranilate isomerase
MTAIKICGIQRAEDAVAAAVAGADFVGLVFVPKRRRQLTEGQAAQIAKALTGHSGDIPVKTPQVVGLFADQPIDEVNRHINSCHLERVQLCGSESLDYCGQILAPVIKVLHVPEGAASDDEVDRLAERIQKYQDSGHLVTLDRQVGGLQGGTGKSFDWSIASRLARAGHEFLLAGGLTPENVAEAVRSVDPWGVDVSSGVETGGVKDATKIRAFIQQVRQAES